MKIRIGYGLGTQGLTGGGERFATLVDNLEGLKFDSLWLSERITGATVDPIVGMAFAAGRTTKLKFGTSVMVLPGRNPAVLAKELASLDVLSGGRLLPGVGLGVADGAEQQGFGVARGDRAAWFDEALPLMRRLWTEEGVVHHGPRFDYEGLTIRPHPQQVPLDVWLGGRAPSELRRVGRLGDGWLPSFTTPEEAAEGRLVIEQAADASQRAIDPEHFGALIPYATGPIPERIGALIAARRPGGDPGEVIPSGLPALRDLIERFADHGFSKFVLTPVTEPAAITDELDALAAAILPLQTSQPIPAP
jgi:probable F420-dependent oxidoreductase